MTANQERAERQSYDARTVQKSSNSIDSDWRKADDRHDRHVEPSTPRGGDGNSRRSDYRDRDHNNRDRQHTDPLHFSSREEKERAMEGSWKKQVPEPVKHQRSDRREPPKHQRGYGEQRDRDDHRDGRDNHRRDARDDRRDARDGRHDGRHHDGRFDHERHERRHRDSHHPQRDREPRERERERDHESFERNSAANSNSWPGESRGGGKHRRDFKDSGDKHKCYLMGEGAKRLNEVLNREFEVCPRQDTNRKSGALPKLKVQAGYLISYVVEHLMEEGEEDEQEVECQIYGGEARAIVAAEHNVEDKKSRPTDLDLRFRIGGKSFESCRDVVERFLLGRLSNEGIPNADEQLIRQNYFQKQVVVGQDFSLLSIGDSGTGRNLDLEFTTAKCDHRCFFDDANAFVIPLPDPANRGWKFCAALQGGGKGRAGAQEGTKLVAQSQSAPWQTAVQYIQNGTLNIDKPEKVFNGLPLYAHALSDKHLTPASKELEHEYGAKFSEKFLEQAEETCRKGDDPLRFIKSFLKSHYPSQCNREINALACLSQILAVLRAHAVLDTITPQRQTIAEKIGETMAEQCLDAIQKVERETMLQVVRFAAHPFSGTVHGRDAIVKLKDGQSLRLRRQMRTDRTTGEVQDGAPQLWESVCKHAAEHLEKSMQDAELDESKRADMEAVCDVLKGLGSLDGAKTADFGEEDASSLGQSSDDEGMSRRSPAASSQSLNHRSSLSSSRNSHSSSTQSPSRGGDESSSQGSGNDVDNDLEDVEGAATAPDASRKTPQVSVQLPTDGESPASPAPASASASMSVSIDSCPGTPSSTTSKQTPTSERRRTPNWSAGPYRPPGRRSATPGTPSQQ